MDKDEARSCSCARHDDDSVTTMLCPVHAEADPCATMAAVTGKRRRGSIVKGVCTSCGWRKPSRERHDADGKAYIAYFRRDPMMHFIWTGNAEDPVQVTHGEAGEPIDDTFEVTIAWDQHTEDVLADFKEACDQYAETEQNNG